MKALAFFTLLTCPNNYSSMGATSKKGRRRCTPLELSNFRNYFLFTIRLVLITSWLAMPLLVFAALHLPPPHPGQRHQQPNSAGRRSVVGGAAPKPVKAVTASKKKGRCNLHRPFFSWIIRTLILCFVRCWCSLL